MYKFEKRLKELGATEDQTSKKLQALIKDFRDNGVNEPNPDPANPVDLDTWDNDLVVEVDKWNKNKGKIEKMLAGKADKRNTPPPVEPVAAPIVEPIITPTPTPTPPAEPIVEPIVEPTNEEDKKGNGIGTFVGVIFAGICLAVGINYFKNRA